MSVWLGWWSPTGLISDGSNVCRFVFCRGGCVLIFVVFLKLLLFIKKVQLIIKIVHSFAERVWNWAQWNREFNLLAYGCIEGIACVEKFGCYTKQYNNMIKY